MVSESTLEFIETHKPKFQHLHRMMRFGNPRQVQGLIDLCSVINTANDLSASLGCEIGCFAGESTLIFLEFTRGQFFIDSVDPYVPEYYKNYQTNHALDCASKVSYDWPQHVLHRETSKQFFVRNNEVIYDWIYIDGNHAYKHVSEDIQNALKHTHERGIICGHDYGMAGVKKAVTEHLGEPDRIFCDGSWLKYKINLKAK